MPSTPHKTGFHIQQVDYVRAIASLSVALFHMGGKALPGLSYGWLGVHMFFLLSGFIICWAIPATYTLRQAGTFIGKRIVRIEPPYVISILLAIAAHFFWENNFRLNWPDILGHLAYINSFNGQPYLSPVYWTLGIEFQFYLFIALCFPLIVKKWGIWLITALCVGAAFLHSPGKQLLPAVFPVFALGMLYYMYLKGLQIILNLLLAGIIITGISVYMSGWLVTCVALLTLLILTAPIKSKPIISFLSKISFSLYLTHDMIGSNVVAYMTMHLPKTFLFKAFSFISGITIALLFAWTFYKMIEEPCLRLSKRIKYTN